MGGFLTARPEVDFVEVGSCLRLELMMCDSECPTMDGSLVFLNLVGSPLKKHRQEFPKTLIDLSFFEHILGRIFRRWTGRPASSHCSPNVGLFPRHAGDHFQPHYRKPFAFVRGRKDGPFSIDLAASHCLSTQSGLQRKSASISPEIREACPYFAIFP